MPTQVIAIAIMAVAVVVTIAVIVAKGQIKAWHFNRHSRPVIAAMVMANNELFDPKSRFKLFPGVVVFGFYEPSPKLCTVLQKIAGRAFELYTAENLAALSPACRQFAKIIKDDPYREDRRYRVPEEICGSLEICAADLYINKDQLSKTFTKDRMIACAVSGRANGKIKHLPPGDEAASRLYGAIRGS